MRDVPSIEQAPLPGRRAFAVRALATRKRTIAAGRALRTDGPNLVELML
jgi:hypothetical protein